MMVLVAARMEEMDPQLEYKRMMVDERDAQLRDMFVHGRFLMDTEYVTDKRSWQFMKDRSWKKWTEGYVWSA